MPVQGPTDEDPCVQGDSKRHVRAQGGAARLEHLF